MSWDWLPIQEHDEDDEAGEVAAEPVVAPGKRTLTQGLAAPDVTGGGHVPHVDRALSLRGGSGRWSYEVQLKVRRVDGAIASGKATGTPAVGPDVALAGKLDVGTLQDKAMIQRVTRDGHQLSRRIAATALRPSARLEDVFPGLTFSVGGELGQASVTTRGDGDVPAISLGSLNVTATGDATRWLDDGGRLRRAGVTVELLAQIKVQIDPEDLRHLARAIEMARRLARMAAESEKVAEQLRRANVAIQKTRAALARATSRGPRGAALAEKLRRRLARMVARREAKRRTASALGALVRKTGAELTETLARVRGAAARLASRAIAKTAAQVIARVLTALNIAMAIVDLVDIARSVYAIAIGAATLHLGGGGGKAAPDGDRVDGNSTTVGDPDALGVGPDDAAIRGDGGTSGDAAAAGGTDGGPDGGDEAGDAAADDAGDADGADDAGDDGEPGDAATDEVGGPGAGAPAGAVASHDDVATGAAGADPDRADLPPDADRGRGSVAIPDDASVVDSAGADPDSPVPLVVTNPNAARVLSALDGLGQPISPRVVEILDVLVPDDLPPAQTAALTDRLVAAAPAGHDADEDALIAALARTVADVLAENDTLRSDPHGGDGGGAKGPRRGRGRGSRRRRASSARGAAPGDAVRRGDAVRVRGGTGLTPTFFDDGSISLSQQQIGRWIAIDGDQVRRSADAEAWLAANRGRLSLDGRRNSPTLTETTVSGSGATAGAPIELAITFVFRGSGSRGVISRRVQVQYDPTAAPGRRSSKRRPASMEPFTRLIDSGGAFAPLRMRHGEAIDLGGFVAKVVASDQPFVADVDTHALFVVTIEVVDVTDPALLEWLGHPVTRGAQITAQVRVPLTAR